MKENSCSNSTSPPNILNLSSTSHKVNAKHISESKQTPQTRSWNQRETLKDSTASSESSSNLDSLIDSTQPYKCLTDIKKLSKEANTSTHQSLSEKTHKAYNTRRNPKKSNKALLLNDSDSNSQRSRRKLAFMEKDVNSAEQQVEEKSQEAYDSGRSTPSKSSVDGVPGTWSSSSTPSNSRPVAPLSLRRQIALALELSKDANQNSTLEPESGEIVAPKKQKQFLPQHRNNKGETELHLAAIRNDFVRIEQILKQHTDEEGDLLIDVNITDFAGWTPLHEACIKGHTQSVRVLVTHGADVNVTSYDGTSPLIDASTEGHLGIVKLLLKHGANPLGLNKKGQNSIDSAANPTIENLLRSYVKLSQEPQQQTAHNIPIVVGDNKEILDLTSTYTASTSGDLQIPSSSTTTVVSVSEPALSIAPVVTTTSHTISDANKSAVDDSTACSVVVDDKIKNESNKIKTYEIAPSTGVSIDPYNSVIHLVATKNESSVTEHRNIENPNMSECSGTNTSGDSKVSATPISSAPSTDSGMSMSSIVNTNVTIESSQSVSSSVTMPIVATSAFVSSSSSVNVTSSPSQSMLSVSLPPNSINTSGVRATNANSFVTDTSTTSSIASIPASSEPSTLLTSLAPSQNNSATIPSTPLVLSTAVSNNLQQIQTISNDPITTVAGMSLPKITVEVLSQNSPMEASLKESTALVQDPPIVVNTENLNSLEGTIVTVSSLPTASDKPQMSTILGDSSSTISTGPTITVKLGGDSSSTPTGHLLRGRKRRRDGGDNDKGQDGSSKKSKDRDGHTTEEETQSDSGSAHHSELPLKVPPLRIVLPPSTTSNSGANLTISSHHHETVSSTSHHDNSFTTVNTASGKYPYVINHDGEDANDSSSSTQAGPNSTPSTRITRSSHRVALQQQKHGDSDEHGLSSGIGTRKKNKNRALRSVITENERSTITGNLNAGHYSQSNSPLNPPPSGGGAAENDENSSSSTTSTIHDLSMNPNLYTYNPANSSTRMFLAIRDHIEKRRHAMVQIKPKNPNAFQDYMMNRCNYMLQSNVDRSATDSIGPPPADIPQSSPLYHLYVEQERERHRMRLRHQVEREKMRLTAEQEYFRVHCRAAHACAGKNIPMSATSFLKDEELNNLLEFESEQNQDNIIITQIKADNPNFLNHGPSGMTASARIKYNGRVFLSWKDDLNDKWSKAKITLTNRQKMEATSLASTQRLNWQWKINEMSEAAGVPHDAIYSSFSSVAYTDHEEMVPQVKIIEDFDLIPA